jgi:hypothetical protein
MYPYPLTPWVWRDPGLWRDQSTDITDAQADRRRVDLAGYDVEALDRGPTEDSGSLPSVAVVPSRLGMRSVRPHQSTRLVHAAVHVMTTLSACGTWRARVARQSSTPPAPRTG